LSLTAQNTLRGIVSFTTSGAFLAAIDSSVPELWLPGPVCDAFEQAFGLTYQNKSNRYVVKDDVHSQLKDLNPSITFQLANNTRNTGKTTNIVLPYGAFDLQLSWPIANGSTNYFPLRRAANESQYTLGRVLLQEAYLIVDFERRNFTISQARFPDINTPPDTVPITSPAENLAREHTLGTPVIVGITVAVFCAVLVVVLAAVFALRRRRRAVQQISEAPPTSETKEAGTEMDSGQPLGKDEETLQREIASGEILELGGEGPHELDAQAEIQELAIGGPQELDSKRVDLDTK
jgi:hypothetical protein